MSPTTAKKQLPVRLPDTEYEALKTYAALTNTPMNQVVTRAVRDFLAGDARQEQMKALLEDGQERFRTALDKLKDL